MDQEIYQHSRLNLLKQLEELRSLRETIIHQENAFFYELPIDMQKKIYLLDRDIPLLQNQCLNIAFIGGFSAGKSSLINAILGEYVVPESTEITTAVPTYLRAIDGEEIAELHYLSKKELNDLDDLYRNEIARRLDQPSLINEPEKQLIEKLEELSSLGQGRRLIENYKLFIEERKNFNASERGITEKIPLEKACDIVRDERKAMFLDRIEFHINMDIPEDIIIVDLPGVSVPNPRHRRLTFDFITHEAHAVVFVLMASRLFDSDETEIFEILRDGGENIREKIFWVLNRWDSLSSQQKESTLEQFNNEIIKFGIFGKIKSFKTNALHGLLSQICIENKNVTDKKLKEHMEDYIKKLPMLYGNNNELALQNSEIPLLKNEILTYINEHIRNTTIVSIIQNAKDNFIQPMTYHLQNKIRIDEEYIRSGANEAIQGELRNRLADVLKKNQNKIKKLFKDLREHVVSERRLLFSGEAKELEQKITEAINKGKETDAYQTYKDILGQNQYRKYPYYFEIEIKIVDRLNSLLKESFREIVANQAMETYKDLETRIENMISELGEDVGYDPQVMYEIEHPVKITKNRLLDQTKGVVNQRAALLDELLLYKPKNFFGFDKGNEIVIGLQDAAKLGTEDIKNTDMPLTEEHMIPKTRKIRETLQQHYIDKVLKFRANIAEGFWVSVRDILIELEREIMQAIDALYYTRLEKIVRKDIEMEFSKTHKGIEIRDRRFREIIDNINIVDENLELILSATNNNSN